MSPEIFIIVIGLMIGQCTKPIFYVFLNRAQLPSKSEACLQSASLDKATLALAASLLPFTALPALAEEASPAAEAVEAVTSAGPTILGFTPFGLGLAFSPVLLYGLFYLYRENVNPKAKVRIRGNIIDM